MSDISAERMGMPGHWLGLAQLQASAVQAPSALGLRHSQLLITRGARAPPGLRLLTSRTEFPAPARPGMAIRPAAAAAAAADGIARGAKAHAH